MRAWAGLYTPHMRSQCASAVAASSRSATESSRETMLMGAPWGSLVRMDTRARTLAALIGAATGVAVGVAVSTSLERHLVRGESMVPALRPRDTVISVRADSVLGRFLRPRRSRIAVIALPGEHALIGGKGLVAAAG